MSVYLCTGTYNTLHEAIDILYTFCTVACDANTSTTIEYVWSGISSYVSCVVWHAGILFCITLSQSIDYIVYFIAV